MSRFFKISEAASLALHTMVFLAGNPHRLIPTREIASVLGASEAHLSKVLQRLVRAGFVTSIRGQKGGFKLKDDGGEITLLEVYESVEGPLELGACLFGAAVCEYENCIFDGVLEKLSEQIVEYMAKTELRALAQRSCPRK